MSNETRDGGRKELVVSQLYVLFADFLLKYILFAKINHEMTEKDVLNYWFTTATEDLETAKDLFKLQRYHHCLFFCHLAIEKLLKGLVLKKTKTHAPHIHHLIKLAQSAGLTILQKERKTLEEITSWNIKTRYDTYKREFYKKATKQFVKKWFAETERIFQWLKKQY